jgi:hypothetical protein
VKPRFELGKVLVTPAAHEVLYADGVGFALGLALERHLQGDWGEVSPDDWERNQQALQQGDRLLSIYTIGKTTFWVITEGDRSVTTVLLPSDY